MANVWAALTGAGEAGAAAGAAEGAIGASQGSALASGALQAASGASKGGKGGDSTQKLMFGALTGGSKIPKAGNTSGFDLSGLFSDGRLENLGGPFAQGGALRAFGGQTIKGPAGNLPRSPVPSFDMLSLLLNR